MSKIWNALNWLADSLEGVLPVLFVLAIIFMAIIDRWDVAIFLTVIMAVLRITSSIDEARTRARLATPVDES